ncbi:hypothetical protein [Pseudomonas sp. BF-R-21]|uniref:hypothetical protein n=1 Tax=Pseudomonas sp. BF-R-21 TaxID=2832387 RepID=UPI001CBEAE80|nr:hypothetical protein [Pseudomonas sp. BF-R-21]
MTSRCEATERALNDPENLYLCWRQLDDGTYVALGRLMFTTALFIGVVRSQYKRRYCFNSAVDAHAEYLWMTTGDDEPTGWIARRPETAEDMAAKAMPNYDPSVFWPKRDD